MFKKMVFAVVPLLMVSTHLFAGDDVLSDVAKLKSDSISDAKISIEAGVGALDFDALAKTAGTDNVSDAIEAHYHGYGGYGGYSNYGYNGYGYGYGNYYGNYSYYPSYYSYGYSPYSFYRPVVYSYPVYSYYWGCY